VAGNRGSPAWDATACVIANRLQILEIGLPRELFSPVVTGRDPGIGIELLAPKMAEDADGARFCQSDFESALRKVSRKIEPEKPKIKVDRPLP
jgi:hypothetical protein